MEDFARVITHAAAVSAYHPFSQKAPTIRSAKKVQLADQKERGRHAEDDASLLQKRALGLLQDFLERGLREVKPVEPMAFGLPDTCTQDFELHGKVVELFARAFEPVLPALAHIPRDLRT